MWLEYIFPVLEFFNHFHPEVTPGGRYKDGGIPSGERNHRSSAILGGGHDI